MFRQNCRGDHVTKQPRRLELAEERHAIAVVRSSNKDPAASLQKRRREVSELSVHGGSMLILLAPTAQQWPESRRKRLVIQDGEAPTGALVWSNRSQRRRVMRDWRDAVSKAFPKNARAVRLAWLLRDLMIKTVFAYPSDNYLRTKLGMPLRKVKQTLMDMDSRGAIVRVQVRIGGEWKRRIFLGAGILNALENAQKQPTSDIASAGTQGPPVGGEYLEKKGRKKEEEGVYRVRKVSK
jgi:hypothetical protein